MDTQPLGSGLAISNEQFLSPGFAPLSGTITVSDNTLIRTEAMNPNWGHAMGAMRIDACDYAFSGVTVNVTGNTIDDSPYEAQWFQVDFGSAAKVGRIVLDLPPSPDWATRSQTLSVTGSTDGTSYPTIVPSASYTFDPSTGNTVTITFSAVSERYLRLTFTANTGWAAGQLSELQAYAS